MGTPSAPPESAHEVIATVENLTSEWRDVDLDLVNDYRVELNRSQKANGVRVLEHFSGGHEIVDNFYDTGKIDCEPDGLLRSMVLSNAKDWMKGTST